MVELTIQHNFKLYAIEPSGWPQLEKPNVIFLFTLCRKQLELQKLSKEEQPNEDLHQTFKNSPEVCFVFICAELPPQSDEPLNIFILAIFLSEVINAFFE